MTSHQKTPMVGLDGYSGGLMVVQTDRLTTAELSVGGRSLGYGEAHRRKGDKRDVRLGELLATHRALADAVSKVEKELTARYPKLWADLNADPEADKLEAKRKAHAAHLRRLASTLDPADG